MILQSRETEEFVILGINFARRFAMKKSGRINMAAASSGPADPEVLHIGGQTYNIRGLHVPIARLAFLPCSICGPSPAGIVINCCTTQVGCVVCRGSAWHDKMVEYLGTSGNHVGQTSQEEIPKEEPSKEELSS